jgi:hypothetical protein
MSVLSYYFTSAARFIWMAPEHVRQHTHGPVTHSSIRLEVIFSDPKKAHRILLGSHTRGPSVSVSRNQKMTAGQLPATVTRVLCDRTITY